MDCQGSISVLWRYEQCHSICSKNRRKFARQVCVDSLKFDTAVHTSFVVGRSWDRDLLQETVSLLLDEFPLSSNVPGGMPEYRRSLMVSFFFKFYWSVTSQLPGQSKNQKLKTLFVMVVII